MAGPIFIAGAPRSGTTLVAKILGRHSSIFMPGETDFFDDIYARAKQLGDPRDLEARKTIIARLVTLYGRFNHSADQERIERLFSTPELLQELETAGQSYRDLLTTFMCIQMRSEGKVRWGNNVPKDLFNIDKILSFYPDAKILVCVRDIRDFLLSYKHFWKVGSSEEHARRKKALYHPLVTSFLWKASIKQVLACQSLIPNHNFLIIKYESLVKEALETVSKMCKVVGVEFESNMLELDWQNSSFREGGDGIFSSSVGRWRTELRNEEVYLAQKIARKELEMLGYGIQTTRISPTKVTEIVATTPYALWKAFYANRDHRGPVAAYAIKRIASLLSSS